MFYLFLAIASSAMVSIFMRISENYVRNTMAMFTANYAGCLVLSRIYVGDIQLFITEDGIGTAVCLGIASGFLYLGTFILLQQNIRHSGIVLSSASMKLGSVLIPIIAAVGLFHERLEWLHLLGIVLAVAAILLINIEKEDISAGSKKSWLIILLAASGITDTMVNIYEETGTEGLKNHYLFYTFLAALLFAFAMTVWRKEKVRKADLCWGLLIGVPNYFSARFILLALGEIPAVIVYPVYSAGALITITLAGLAVFREKLSRQKAAALVLILAALITLNIS